MKCARYIRANCLARIEFHARICMNYLTSETFRLPVNKMRSRLRTALYTDIQEHVRRTPMARPEDYRGWTNDPPAVLPYTVLPKFKFRKGLDSPSTLFLLALFVSSFYVTGFSFESSDSFFVPYSVPEPRNPNSEIHTRTTGGTP